MRKILPQLHILLLLTCAFIAPAFANTAEGEPLQARSSFVRGIMLRWEAVAGATATGYQLEYSGTGEEANFELLATVPAGQLSYRHSGLEANQTVFYRHKAVFEVAPSANGGYHNIASATTSSSETVRIMPLGDSNTEGGSGSVPKEQKASYRKNLYKQLVEDGKLNNYRVDFVGSEQSGSAFSESFLKENGFAFDLDHAGFGGARDEDIAELLKSGKFNFYSSNTYRGPDKGPYLDLYDPHVILLHIGTNWIDDSPWAADDVEAILNQVDAYEDRTNTEVVVVLAKIILTDGSNPNLDDKARKYSQMVRQMAVERIADSNDLIVFADMEEGAGLVYSHPYNLHDMADQLHPNQTGYDKMAEEWMRVVAPVLASPAAPLPVELTEFKVAQAGPDVLLRWSTASEENNIKFVVERKQEEQAFNSIGEVAGAGNSLQHLDYTFRDGAAPAGMLYYRLKQVDTDGSATYSKTVAVQTLRALPGQALLYPNLTTGQEPIALSAAGYPPAAPVAVTVNDTMGRTVYAGNLTAHANGEVHTELRLPNNLNKGLYLVQLSAGNSVQRVKLMIR